MFSLLYTNLMVAYLFWSGWLEDCGMIVPVKVGFLYMDVIQLVGGLMDSYVVMSR